MKQLFATMAVLFALSACSDSSKQVLGAVYPTGIATDPVSLHDTKGVYTGDSLCCWLAGEANFFVPARPGATEVLLQTYEPAIASLGQSQTITIATAGSTQRVSRPVHAGKSTETFPILPGMLVNGNVAVHIVMGNSVVPKDVGLNGDLRRLSIILLGATAQ